MTSKHHSISDSVIDAAYDAQVINSWEVDFLLKLDDFHQLSEKQQAKLDRITYKISRAIDNDIITPKSAVPQIGDFRQVIEDSVCPHCRRAL
ncbi:MAG TPA: hypothetical protein VGI45_09145 [Terracidiphilus sp.]|jgi:hypothetical protein